MNAWCARAELTDPLIQGLVDDCNDSGGLEMPKKVYDTKDIGLLILLEWDGRKTAATWCVTEDLDPVWLNKLPLLEGENEQVPS